MGRPGRRIDVEDQLAALVAREERDEGRSGFGGRDAGKVGEGVVVPGHVAALAVYAHEPEGDVCVGGAGGGIAVRARGELGLRRIGDPPGAHGGVIAALDEQAGAVGQPPVAAHAVHLPSRDEIGESPTHVI